MYVQGRCHDSDRCCTTYNLPGKQGGLSLGTQINYTKAILELTSGRSEAENGKLALNGLMAINYCFATVSFRSGSTLSGIPFGR